MCRVICSERILNLNKSPPTRYILIKSIAGVSLLNIRIVAARAGVSIATVSRVMSGSPHVLPETAGVVQRAIEELNFIPSASATTLKYGRSDTFGVIIADIINPFFLEFIRERMG